MKKNSVLINVTKAVLLVTIVTLIGLSLYYVITQSAPKIKNLFSGENSTTINETVKLASEENVVIDVVEKSSKSVVSIALSKLELKEGQGVVDSGDNIGTGFVVDKSGLIITNQHVVSQLNQDYRVVTADGKSYEVEDIIIDDSNDIALLKINATDLVPLSLGDSSKLKVGQLVIAIGTPLGEYAGSVTTGIISGLNRSVTTRSGSFWSQTSQQYDDVIQTDAAINPGNSGGPLLNSSGEVIGVNFATTSGADNISFALPANSVSKRLEEYRKFGKFIRPYMGVEYRTITKLEEQYYQNVKAGALIIRVVSNSPASKGGLKKGDIITKFGDKAVDSALASMISDREVGEEIKLEVYRDGKMIELKVKLEESR